MADLCSNCKRERHNHIGTCKVDTGALRGVGPDAPYLFHTVRCQCETSGLRGATTQEPFE
jgi:hypothetical protein